MYNTFTDMILCKYIERLLMKKYYPLTCELDVTLSPEMEYKA
jgi:hypothetical protein